jgi:hypothetical protein
MSRGECCEEPEATWQPPEMKRLTGPGGCFTSLAISDFAPLAISTSLRLHFVRNLRRWTHCPKLRVKPQMDENRHTLKEQA